MSTGKDTGEGTREDTGEGTREDTAGESSGRRRRRRRPARQQGVLEATDQPTSPAPEQPPDMRSAAARPARRRKAPKDTAIERGLKDIVGAGRSQVGVSGALRARDVNRPTDEDLAAAERDVVIVRRNWKPPASG